MKKIFTKQWFKAAGIRSLKTVCQTAVATIGTTFIYIFFSTKSNHSIATVA